MDSPVDAHEVTGYALVDRTHLPLPISAVVVLAVCVIYAMAGGAWWYVGMGSPLSTILGGVNFGLIAIGLFGLTMLADHVLKPGDDPTSGVALLPFIGLALGILLLEHQGNSTVTMGIVAAAGLISVVGACTLALRFAYHILQITRPMNWRISGRRIEIGPLAIRPHELVYTMLDEDGQLTVVSEHGPTVLPPDRGDGWRQVHALLSQLASHRPVGADPVAERAAMLRALGRRSR